MSIVDTRSALLAGGRIKLKQAIIEGGYRSLLDMAEIHNLSKPLLFQLASGEEFKFYKKGELHPLVMKVMVVLNKRMDELFDEDEYLSQEQPYDERVDYAERVFAERFQPWDIENYVDDERLKRTLDAKIEDLTPREQHALRKLYAIDGERMTLLELGLSYPRQVGPERARQIEAKALRKLRHPSRSDELREFLNPEEYIEDKYRTSYYTAYWDDGETTVSISRDLETVRASQLRPDAKIVAVYKGPNVKYKFDSLTGLWYDRSGPTPTEGLEQARQQEQADIAQGRLERSRRLEPLILQSIRTVESWERKLDSLAVMAEKGETTLFVTGLPAFAAQMDVFKGRISEYQTLNGKLGRHCSIDAMREWISAIVVELNQSITEMTTSFEGLVFYGNQFYIAGTEPKSE